MPELRRDLITGRQVLIAPERGDRPMTAAARWEFQQGQCPFCPGHEEETPAALLVERAGESQIDGPWQVRVVPNKFPAVSLDGVAFGAPANRGVGSEAWPATSRPAAGSHEVIIESPRHVLSLTDLAPHEILRVGEVYRRRLAALADDPRLAYALLFKNVGAAGGASLEHTHSQILATDEVPELVARELAGAKRFFEERGQCVYCHLADQERQAGERLVLESDGFLAWAPFASRWPLELWILPRAHHDRYDRIEPRQAVEFGHFLQRVLARLERVLPDRAYNFFLHQGPFDRCDLPHYHWHVEVIPRMTTVAGFEWGTDWFINPVAPELAAAALRGAAG